MVLAFNASWTPYAIVCTLKLFNKNFISPSWTIPGLLLAKRWATFWSPNYHATIIYTYISDRIYCRFINLLCLVLIVGTRSSTYSWTIRYVHYIRIKNVFEILLKYVIISVIHQLVINYFSVSERNHANKTFEIFHGWKRQRTRKYPIV